MQWRCLIPTFALSICLALVPVGLSAATTSNLAREKNWADQVVDFLVAGDAVWLEARGIKFLALYTQPGETQKASKRGVILLHGRGVHPAWGFINTLRIDLAEAGWHTLSLQMPILETDVKLAEYAKTFPEAFERIDAGVRYLQQQGISKIYLLGHSSGAMTGVAYATEHPKVPVVGIIAIGLSTEPGGGPLMQPAMILPRITVPVLDIFGANDLPSVLSYMAARAQAGRLNKGYVQMRVPGTNHFFTDRYDELKSRILDWLKQN